MLPGKEAAEAFIDAALARIFSPNGEAHRVATLVMRDGTRRDVSAPDIISGAIIENIARKAKYQACLRALSGQSGIRSEDVLDAVDSELYSAAKSLSNPRNARDILGLSLDMDFRVELAEDLGPGWERHGHHYLDT